jgi:hypothetical protein
MDEPIRLMPRRDEQVLATEDSEPLRRFELRFPFGELAAAPSAEKAPEGGQHLLLRNVAQTFAGLEVEQAVVTQFGQGGHLLDDFRMVLEEIGPFNPLEEVIEPDVLLLELAALDLLPDLQQDELDEQVVSGVANVEPSHDMEVEQEQQGGQWSAAHLLHHGLLPD